MWIKQQPKEKLESWIRYTKTPMLATMPDGEILWVNKSFEDLLGYTSVELVGKKTWIELTRQDDDLEYDEQMAQRVVAGVETDYQLQKHYITKAGAPKQVIIDVLRYPLHGDFECFLVAVIPLDVGVQFATQELAEIRKLLLKLIGSADPAAQGITLEKLSKFAKEHPAWATAIAALLIYKLFGADALEVIKTFITIKAPAE